MFQYIPLIVLWASLSSGKASFQGHFLRKNAKNSTDNLLFNCLIFWAAAVAMTALFCRSVPSVETLIYGSVFGICSILYQYLYSSAMECGPMSLTVMFNTFYLVITIAAGIVFFDDSLKATALIGIIILFVALYFLLGGRRDDRSVSLRWLLRVTGALLLSGGLTVEMRVFKMTESGSETGNFVAVAYLVAGIVSTVIVLLRSGKCRPTVRINGKTLLAATIPGVLLGMYQIMQLFLIPKVPAGMLYPICNGSVTMLSALIGVLFFRDRLSQRQVIGLFLGTAAIVLCSI